VTRFFLDKMYSAEARDLTDQIVQGIQAEFATRLAERDWLSDQVKKVAKEKIDSIKRKIGYPKSPLVVDPLAIKAFYADLKLTKSYPDNVLATARITVSHAWSQLGKPVDRETFFSSALDVNAYYNPQLNEIAILTGIQQFPVYDRNFPGYMLYGGIGSIVG
jgi:endothelin-converting enzyme